MDRGSVYETEGESSNLSRDSIKNMLYITKHVRQCGAGIRDEYWTIGLSPKSSLCSWFRERAYNNDKREYISRYNRHLSFYQLQNKSQVWLEKYHNMQVKIWD